jgi:hypothetical protein
MEEDNLEGARELILRDFEIESTDDPMTEEELFNLLANQIAYMIEYKLEFLLSLMYRLDISEHKVNHALSPFSNDPANIALAKIVWERQKQRAFTKKFYKQDKLDNLDGLEY